MKFFPTPYPDECLYSIFCRYFVRSGSTSNKRTVFELFGEAQSLASFVYLPRRLELVEEWVGKGSLITRERLADGNSCYGYFSVAFPEAMLQGMEKKITKGGSDRSLERQMIQKCRRSHWPEYLRYCPECTKEDIERFGETYWHRLPQLPGVEYCPVHGTAIQNSSVHLKETTMRFLPASHALRRLDKKDESGRQVHKEKYLMIAKDSEWLLSNGRRMKGCREVARKYKELFMEKGLTTAQGIRYTERIKSEFINYHGEGFLNQLFPDRKNPLYWLDFAFVSVSEHLRPLHHILLMEFLKGSAEGFYKAEPDNEPYGSGPWPCINKLCRHYGKDSAEKVSVSYLNGQTIGQFYCAECGMRYQRSRPWQTFGEYASHAVKLDYGHLWYDKLRKCILEDELCPSDVAKA
ncbi:MAG: TnsD family transposase, partial [Butyrivibrio sp.]|nr:TnsD family transposase [Butyrivibrio sp.]